jgi:hypothetical protein
MMSQALVRRALAAAFALSAILVIGSATPTVAYAVNDVTESNVFTLPLPPGQKGSACSFGDVVLWTEEAGVRGYDWDKGEYLVIPSPPGARGGGPQMSANWIAFQAKDFVGSNTHVYAYNRSTGETIAVSHGPGYQGPVWISGDTIVWYGDGLYGMNLSTGATFTVSTSPGLGCTAGIAGDWVVYPDSAGAHGDDIKSYNITTKETRTLCDWPGDQYLPVISENGFVVWQSVSDPSRPDATMDLYGCSVYGGQIRKIAGGRGSQHDESIGGNLIVYMDDAKPGGYGLVGYDLLSDTRFGISKKVSWYYEIAGIEDGTIARIYDDYSKFPWTSVVQVVCPTELDVISEDPAADESVDIADEGIQGEENPSGPLAARSVSSLASIVRPTAANVSTVVVAASSDWSDAAIACSLAGRVSPVLFTDSASGPARVLSKLAALAPEHVLVVGGPSSVSANAVSQIASVVGAGNVTRAEGTTAESRSLAAATVVASRAGWNGTVLIASGSAASLMAVPASVWKGLPLVVTDSNGLSSAQIAGLKALGAKKFVVVGASVLARTLARLRTAAGKTNVKLIKGTTTASTSATFASWAVSTCGMSWNGLAIASTSNWSHTLTAALSEGRARSVVLMTDHKTLSAPVKSALVTHHRTIRDVNFVGRTSIVSNKVRAQVRLAIK